MLLSEHGVLFFSNSKTRKRYRGNRWYPDSYKLATHSAPVDSRMGITCSMSEMQNRSPPTAVPLGLLSQILNFNKMPRYFLCTFTFEKNCFTGLFITTYPKFRNLQTELGKIRWRLKKTRLEYDCN